MINQLPTFSTINPQTIHQILKDLLKKQKDQINSLLSETTSYTWNNLIAPLEQLNIELQQFWSPISHLHSVCDTAELRAAYTACLPDLSAFSTWVGHHFKLYQAISSIKASPDFHTLTTGQQTVINNNIRDFKLAGIELNETQKKSYAKLSEKLSLLSTQFEQNVLDSSQSWSKHITDPNELSGISDAALNIAQQKAKEKNLEGWILTLDAPCYLAVIQYADSAALRHEIYQAYTTRASEQGPHNAQYDNSEVMHSIMQARLKLAQLLGFKTYASYSLATKMIDETQDVFDFLKDLANASLPAAKTERERLTEYAKNTLNIDTLNAWDISYVSEKYRKAHFDINQEELRPYFPLPQVLKGLFQTVEKLFEITVRQITQIDTWHKDVQCFQCINKDGDIISTFYLDLFAREGKRNGAWMNDYQGSHLHLNNNYQKPIAYIVCNFAPPVNNTPSLLSHDDIITLFHEFGHATQHMFTTIDIASISGINGIPWDAVEVASQFLENWAWQPCVISQLSSHHITGEALPQDMLDKMIAAKNYNAGLAMMRQIEFALFDFELHASFQPEHTEIIQEILDNIRQQYTIFDTPDFNRFQHAFSHIFGGGYAAGYYSYKWAEVMAADLFSVFLEKGIFDKDTSQRYKDTILALGGAYEPMDVFIRFKGKKPEIDALLKSVDLHTQ